MACITLETGADYSCGGFAKRYHQQVVIVNKEDVLNWSIQVSKPIPGIPTVCRHRIKFQLKENKSGHRFTFPEKGSMVFGSFGKVEDNNRTEYSHRVQIAVYGIDEDLKCMLRMLDSGGYFAAIQFVDGTVEIYGFEYGLRTNNYTFDPQSAYGGGVIELVSDGSALEDEPPFVYFANGNENEDFNNNFTDNDDVILGDFNNDFNNDFFTLAT